jgi:anti-sigma regulatory factor (Ser/Thr protein kinase)
VAATSPTFDRMVPAVPDAIGALRRELRRWVRRQGASPVVQANVALAFSEACTSIIGPRLEAEPDADWDDGGPLVLQAAVDGDELAVRVSHRSRPARASTGDVGYGFGLALITRICDRFEVRRRADRPGTELLMIFSLERAAPSPAPARVRSSPRQPSRSSTRR